MNLKDEDTLNLLLNEDWNTQFRVARVNGITVKVVVTILLIHK